MSDVEILNSASNAVVARHIDREYPGVLIQGDTLRIILDEIDELIEELAAKDIDSAKEISGALQQRFIDLLSHYEKVMEDHNLPLPYMSSVQAKK
jgi:hypothetical protein